MGFQWMLSSNNKIVIAFHFVSLFSLSLSLFVSYGVCPSLWVTFSSIMSCWASQNGSIILVLLNLFWADTRAFNWNDAVNNSLYFVNWGVPRPIVHSERTCQWATWCWFNFVSTCTAENVAIDIDSLAPPVPLHYGRMALGNHWIPFSRHRVFGSAASSS